MTTPETAPVFAFEVSVTGTDWKQIVNARTRGKAKAEYHRQVLDAWPDVPFTKMRCRKIGPPHSSERFLHNARYRGMPDVRCGQRVSVGDESGVIVGHNDSANFDVLFDAGSKYGETVLNVHPESLTIL